MKLPRDLSGSRLIKALSALDYEKTRQRGSHARVTTQRNGEHHEVIPLHNPIKPKTLSGIFKSVAAHHQITQEDLIHRLDL
ncbi:type II toxin-antitoxin system HicA family toxin [bacterium]|jgi:predicted RNA binding protein YcfA (HicA-like mRNA interferase family)|nr:type II toxin-antitoxin system HicA family toxin [bacterium]MDA7657816.1 type II toxin-antitoxin system HicA family toxin [Verrucomicrobiota bacterium]